MNRTKDYCSVEFLDKIRFFNEKTPEIQYNKKRTKKDTTSNLKREKKLQNLVVENQGHCNFFYNFFCLGGGGVEPPLATSSPMVHIIYLKMYVIRVS